MGNSVETRIGFVVASDKAVEQFTFVKLDDDTASSRVPKAGHVITCGDGEASVGIALEASPMGVESTIAVQPLNGLYYKVKAGATWSANANLKSDAEGKAQTATSGDVILANGTEVATEADAVFTVLTDPAKTTES